MSKKEKLAEAIETLLDNLEDEGQGDREDVQNVREALEDVNGL